MHHFLSSSIGTKANTLIFLLPLFVNLSDIFIVTIRTHVVVLTFSWKIGMRSKDWADSDFLNECEIDVTNVEISLENFWA